jgi:hypothetical protein
MRSCIPSAVSLSLLLACSGSAEPGVAPGREVGVLPLGGDDAGAVAFVHFMDEATGFATQDVHDANREIVRFDAEHGAMVSLGSGDAVSGWAATGNELSWSRSGVEFRVRFGTEQGERRAFFTETVAGTICDLRLYGPEQLGISGTSELPPTP